MRLERVRNGHRLKHKLMLHVMRWMSGDEPPDVVKTMLYRPEFFGAPFSALVHDVLRGPSAWAVGERELFAAFVSKQNRCLF